MMTEEEKEEEEEEEENISFLVNIYKRGTSHAYNDNGQYPLWIPRRKNINTTTTTTKIKNLHPTPYPHPKRAARSVFKSVSLSYLTCPGLMHKISENIWVYYD